MSDLAVRNKRSALAAGGVALAMLGLGYASVPLYRIFCQVTGYQGTTQRASAADLPKSATARMVRVRFDTNVAPNLPWTFKPERETDDVEVGARDMAFFIARNNSSRSITGTAAFNVSPDTAGKYFTKIQCFCFTQQTLKPGEQVRMPVIFFVDPKMLKDHDADDIQEITLSYTFFPVDPAKSGS
jgi:cytochrome c oxidase assembly protein subunit 11